MTTDRQLQNKARDVLAKMTDRQRDLAAHYLLGRLLGDFDDGDLDYIRAMMERDQ